jgi:hypothetical protein
VLFITKLMLNKWVKKLPFTNTKNCAIVISMKILLVDCFGCVFDSSFFTHVEEPGLTDADYFRLKYENPNRSIENQQSTVNYLTAINSLLDTTKYDSLYLIGTNGEVLTASFIVSHIASHYSNAPKYINTEDKYNFARDYLLTESDDVTFITDQYFSEVYKALNTKNKLKIKLKVVERFTDEVETPKIEEILAKHQL